MLAAASSSTHVSSFAYFLAMSWLGFRALSRVAVLADFDEAPPERVLTSVPTAGLSAVAIAGGALAAVPLFFVLPRLHGPFVTAPIRVDDAFTRALSADRVDLESFGAAKRSDRVVLRMTSSPDIARDAPLRLREAVFTEYQEGSWIRNPRGERRRGSPALVYGTGENPNRKGVDWRVVADLYVFGNGFLFLPYGTTAVRMERSRAVEVPDGVMQVASRRGPVRYEADVQRVLVRGPGQSAISPADVPGGHPEVRHRADGEPHRAARDLQAHRGSLPAGLRVHARPAEGRRATRSSTFSCARRPDTASTSRRRRR